MSNKYIIQNLDNYNKFISESYSTIVYKYIDIINNYIILSFDYRYLYTNNNIIIKKGIDTLQHIFNIIFLYTLNLELTTYHCDKATYYYIEFISQMSGDNNVLQLTSKDISLFVFKKTIFDLSNDNKVKHTISKKDKSTIELVKMITNIYNKLIYTIIDTNDNDNETKTLSHYKIQLSNVYKSMNYILSSIFENITAVSVKNNLKNSDKDYVNREKYINKLNVLDFILDIFNEKDYKNKSQMLELIIKKLFNLENLTLIHTDIQTIKYKVYDDLFNEYLENNNSNKLVNWLFS